MTLEEIKLRAGLDYVVDANLIEAAKCLKRFASEVFVGWGDAATKRIEEEMQDSYIYLVKDFLDLLIAGAQKVEDSNDDEK